jgi:hypothetical protein
VPAPDREIDCLSAAAPHLARGRRAHQLYIKHFHVHGGFALPSAPPPLLPSVPITSLLYIYLPLQLFLSFFFPSSPFLLGVVSASSPFVVCFLPRPCPHRSSLAISQPNLQHAVLCLARRHPVRGRHCRPDTILLHRVRPATSRDRSTVFILRDADVQGPRWEGCWRRTVVRSGKCSSTCFV